MAWGPTKALVFLQRLLGLIFNPDGDSSDTGKMLVKKAKSKLENVNIPKSAGPSICSLLSQVYVTPTINWSLVFARIDLKELNDLDTAQSKKFKRHFGLALSDSSIALF